jgi:hypothetical protein
MSIQHSTWRHTPKIKRWGLYLSLNPNRTEVRLGLGQRQHSWVVKK